MFNNLTVLSGVKHFKCIKNIYKCQAFFASLHCIPHSANHCMVTVFTLHMMRSIPNAGRYPEYSIEFDEAINRTARDLFSPNPEVSGGLPDLPPEPGWGIRINDGWLQTASYQKSELKA